MKSHPLQHSWKQWWKRLHWGWELQGWVSVFGICLRPIGGWICTYGSHAHPWSTQPTPDVIHVCTPMKLARMYNLISAHLCENDGGALSVRTSNCRSVYFTSGQGSLNEYTSHLNQVITLVDLLMSRITLNIFSLHLLISDIWLSNLH